MVRGGDEYFAKRDMEKLKKLREKLDMEREELRRKMEKESHWMKCPKCGGDLKEQLYRGVMIDVCSECGGVWLDKGELELLAGTESGFVSSLLSMILKKRRNSWVKYQGKR